MTAVATLDAQPELHASLTALSELSAGSRPLDETLTRVAVLAARTVPGADGAGLTLLERAGPDIRVAGEDLFRVVEEVQYRWGEGPCPLAVVTRATQVCGSLGVDPRWPRFGPGAARLGVHSALSLPLLVDERVLGALNMYGRARHAFDERSVHAGETFCAPAAVTVAVARVFQGGYHLARRLEDALRGRAAIDQAIGILMARHGCRPWDAFDHLRATSEATGTDVTDVARRLVEHTAARARGPNPREPPP